MFIKGKGKGKIMRKTIAITTVTLATLFTLMGCGQSSDEIEVTDPASEVSIMEVEPETSTDSVDVTEDSIDSSDKLDISDSADSASSEDSTDSADAAESTSAASLE